MGLDGNAADSDILETMEKLILWIKEQGLTQLQAAEKIGISRSYLAEIVTGKAPGRETIRKIDEATGGKVSPAAWFAGAGASDGR